MYNYKNSKKFSCHPPSKVLGQPNTCRFGTTFDDKQNKKHYLHFTTEFIVTMTRVHDYNQDKTGNKTRNH